MYDDVARRATKKYRKEKQKQMTVEYKTEIFDKISACIEKSGMKRATFIKTAIEEKIERDGLGSIREENGDGE